jgi:hypothetical protein
MPLVLFLFAFSCSNSSTQKDFEEKVVRSVKKQLLLYPESCLQDLYKNFYQDRFGPGHLIPDTAMAGRYLREELASFEWNSNDTTNLLDRSVEAIGWEHRFYRVGLYPVKEKIIPYSVFLEAFIESANTTPEIQGEAWKAEWNQILSFIDQMNLNLPNYEKDKINIQKQIDSGDYAMHHSEVFEKAYQPHYRIIKKEIYTGKIQPLLNDSRTK